MNEKLTASVKEFTLSLGADLVGVVQADSFGEAPEGHQPEDILRGAKSVIVMAVRMLNPSFESAPSREYAISVNIVSHELDRIAFRLGRFIQDKGFRALPVPCSFPYDLKENMGDLSHRHAGHLAGIGVLGKNDLLLTEKFGSRIRLVTVITDAELKADAPLYIDLCKDCDKCIMACPCGALKGDRIVDKSMCEAQHIKVGERLHLGDMDICGVCIRVCPVGVK